MLSLLGVIFYVFSAQERSNAEYYSEASKERSDPSLDADTLFDWALEQIIVGTDPRLKNSVLWGSRYSLLSNALGHGLHRPSTDMQPYNGAGVNIIYDAPQLVSGNYVIGVDQNRNGLVDDPTVNPSETDNRYLLNYVDSPAAQNLYERPMLNVPQGDVGYTYPDNNNIFLAYVGKVRDNSGNVHRVVKPSYLLPGILRTASGAPNANWYQDPSTGGRVMRAHPSHVFVPPTSSPGTPVSRYLTQLEAAGFGPTIKGFPFAPMDPTYDTNPMGAGQVYTTGRMGAYSYVDLAGNLSNEPVEFDYDNDGDGFRESILIDLDFPPQQDSSGNMFVPLFLVTIHDLDALLNLNIHGNLAKVLYSQADLNLANVPVSNQLNPFGTDNASGTFSFISKSNLGIGPAEVNPLWALNARAGTDNTNAAIFTQHQKFFLNSPVPASGASFSPSWGETANMEFLWSKIGRLQFGSAAIDDLYPGAYGDMATLYQAYTSGTLSDVGGLSLPRPGIPLQDDNGDVNEGQGIWPYFQQPLDYTGLGSYSLSQKQLDFVTVGLDKRIRYTNYDNSSRIAASSNILWGTIPDGQLPPQSAFMPKSLSQALRDDPYEIALYAPDRRDIDTPFSSEEMLYLQLSNTEINRLNVTSRLANLFPFNFARSTADNARGEFIRHKFTTESNDRKSFSFPLSARNEYTIDSQTGTAKFPPQFGSIPRYQTTANQEDPLRMAVRYLLEIEIGATQPINRLQRKLSINSLLAGNTTTTMGFRSLTPHPDDPGTTPISTTYPAPTLAPYPPPTSMPDAQEFWARRDRQYMARDIYVLLYLLGHGDDGTSPATDSNAGGTVYDDVRLAEMAQFAVNLVDAMDHDQVITRFEYDKDLSDGWNLDDDATTTSESNRDEVFGVERLDLSISEAMVVRASTSMSGNDHPASSHMDSADHTFAYMELYNQSPFDVKFDDKESWQVVIKPQGGAERRLSFKGGAGGITSGKQFSIGSPEADLGGSAPGKSIFKVDPAWTGGTPDFTKKETWIIPYQKALDLDLLDPTTPTSVFRVEDGAAAPNSLTTAGDWVSQLSGVPTNTAVTFQLRRRAHQTRSRMSPPTSATENDNPWVTVDEMTITSLGQFQLDTATDDSTELKKQLDKILGSRQRAQSLDSNSEAPHAKSDLEMGVGSVDNNSFGRQNSNASAATYWQPHFDRDYVSVMELLNLPVFGPSKLTSQLKDMWTDPKSQSPAASASAYFLVPNSTVKNRWHRVLEFLEVPTRTNRNLAVGSELAIPRVPGRINLNTIRHPDVLMALLDDTRVVSMNLTGDPEIPLLPDQVGDRDDWWNQFVRSRDTIDPYWELPANGGISVALPGLPIRPDSTIGRPFRSLADVSYTTSSGTKTPSVEDTILRSLPQDIGTANPRGLFEVGSDTEHTTGVLDPILRNRLLSKIHGNTTTRSNCFAIFISVKYFQAVVDPNPAANGAIRIGGPLNGKPAPEHRGFFVVDRSKLEQGKYSGAANYDFRAFINYRKTLE